jgi:hypothetical protein
MLFVENGSRYRRAKQTYHILVSTAVGTIDHGPANVSHGLLQTEMEDRKNNH